MTTLRRILMATAQEQPVLAEVDPKKKHSRRRFEEEQELHFDHGRNGYKRKRKEMGSSGSEKSHKDRDKLQSKRKLERSPSYEKDKHKSKAKKLQDKKRSHHGSKHHKHASRVDGNGIVKEERKKKKKHVQEPAEDVKPKSNGSVGKPAVAKSPELEVKKVKLKPPQMAKEPSIQTAAVAKEPEKPKTVDSKSSPQPKTDVDKGSPRLVKDEKEVDRSVTKIAPSAGSGKVGSKPGEVNNDKVKPEAMRLEKNEKNGSSLTRTPVEQSKQPSNTMNGLKTEKAKVKKHDETQTQPGTVKPVKKVKERTPKEDSSKVQTSEKQNSSTGTGSDEATAQKEKIVINSPEKKRKREETKDSTETEPTSVKPVDRPPKRIASMNCPGTKPGEIGAKTEATKGKSKQDLKKDEVKPETTKLENKSRALTNRDAKVVDEKTATADNKDWVQCERCKEWFELPDSVSPSTLPDHWYCEMQTWGTKNTRCAPPSKDAKRNARPPFHSSGKKRSRSGASEKHGRTGNTRNRSRNNAPPSRPRINSLMSGGVGDAGLSKSSNRGSWKWVMCETCNQWRKVPPEVDLEKLPDKWYCSMNKWDPSRASCSAPQEADDAQNQTTKVASAKKFVTLPDGVNMYGGQIWPVQKKQSPMNYRELIVNHYRNYKQWEVASSKVLNERYDGSSLFVPRDVVRVKSSKNGSRKTLTTNPRTDGISKGAIVEESLFRKFFPATKLLPNPDSEDEEETKNEEHRESVDCLLKKDTHGSGLLKLTKPWKRGNRKWQSGQDYFCSSSK